MWNKYFCRSVTESTGLTISIDRKILNSNKTTAFTLILNHIIVGSIGFYRWEEKSSVTSVSQAIF